jgi:hypothetical protein
MAEKFFRPVVTYPIESQTLTEFQGEKIPTENLPFQEGHIEQFSVVGNSSKKSKRKQPILVQTSVEHGRTFEMQFNESGYIIFEDEHNNIFGKLTTKGNNVNKTVTYKDSNAPSGFVYNGLLDSDSLVRQLRASALLREEGIDTEMIIKLMQPEALPYDKKLFTIPELKKRHLDIILEGKNRKKRLLGTDKVTLSDLPAISKSLKDIGFFVAVRALQVNERLSDFDLLQRGEQEKFHTILQDIFTFVNISEKVQALRDETYTPEHFNVDDAEDIARYFSTYLPFAIGINYGKLHNRGLLHKFAHLGNISGVGSMYDLDSMIGEPLGLGDEEVTEKEKIDEFRYVVYGSNTHQLAGGIRNVVAGLATKGMFDEDRIDILARFNVNAIIAYIAERGFEDDILENIAAISRLYDDFRGLEDKIVEGHYREKLSEQMGWNHEFEGGLFDILPGFGEYLMQGYPGEHSAKNPKKEITAIYDFRRLLDFINLKMDENVREMKKEELAQIEERYGEDTQNAVVMLFADRDAQRLTEELKDRCKDGSIYPKLNEATQQTGLSFDKDMIRRYMGTWPDSYLYTELPEDTLIHVFFIITQYIGSRTEK